VTHFDVADTIRRLPQRYVPDVDIELLEDFPGNAKEHDLGAIMESMEANGFAGAVIAQDRGELPPRIIAGHGTRTTARAGGMQTVPVLLIECSDAVARRLVLAYNRLPQKGGYNEPLLAELLKTVATDTESGGLRGTGYDGDDVDDLVARMSSLPFATAPNTAADRDAPHTNAGDRVELRVQDPTKTSYVVSAVRALLEAHPEWKARCVSA
jgi:hypothetical protein